MSANQIITMNGGWITLRIGEDGSVSIESNMPDFAMRGLIQHVADQLAGKR